MEKLRNYAKSLLKTNRYIRTTDFAQFHNHTAQDITEVMLALEKQEKVKSVLETKCPYCGKWTGKHYPAFWELPKRETCPHCSKDFGDVVTDNSYLVWENLTLGQE